MFGKTNILIIIKPHLIRDYFLILYFVLFWKPLMTCGKVPLSYRNFKGPERICSKLSIKFGVFRECENKTSMSNRRDKVETCRDNERVHRSLVSILTFYQKRYQISKYRIFFLDLMYLFKSKNTGKNNGNNTLTSLYQTAEFSNFFLVMIRCIFLTVRRV